MNERILAKNKTSTTPPQATQASSSLMHQGLFNDELSDSFDNKSNISKELGGIQPKTIRRGLNWRNITVEAPSRGNWMSLPGGTQRQQEEPGAVIGNPVSVDGQSDQRTMKQKKADLDKAIVEADRIIDTQGATPDTVKAKLPELELKYRLKFAKLLKDSDSNYYINIKINPEGSSKKRKFGEMDDAVKGAFALYRGIHFKKDWKQEDYQAQLEKNLVGEPTFSAAARQIAGSKKPDGSDVSKDKLEEAAKRVREKVEQTKNVENVKKWWGDKNQVFDNLFLVMIQDYVNRYAAFEKELQKAESGQYKDLEFISIPIISTSKIADHGARYALGEKGTLKEQKRTEGEVVGRIFIYLFTAKQLVNQGAINIQDLQNKEKVTIKARILKEGEVAFTGSIPGENLVAQRDAKLSDNAKGLGNIAEEIAKNKAQNQGGLRQWEP